MFPLPRRILARPCARRSAALVLGAWVGAALAAGADATVRWGQPETARYVVDAFGADRGFTKANVTTVLQAQDGYIWIGTGSGLSRFDGIRFVSYRISNTPAFESNFIECLYEDRQGRLWIGTERGLVRYEHGVFSAVGPRGVSIHAVAEDRSGAVWIGSYGQGLYRCTHDRVEDANPPGGLPSGFISCLLVDSADRLWMGFDRGGTGLVCRTAEGFRRVDEKGVLDDQVGVICERPAGTLWFGTHSSGLVRLRHGVFSRYSVREETPNPSVTDLKPARSGGLWVAADSVLSVSDLEAPVPQPVPRLPDHDVTRLCEDSEGGLWICAKEDGLFRAPPAPYLLISATSGLASNRVKIVTADPAGNLWLSVDRGDVTEVSAAGRVSVRTPAEGFPTRPPRSLFADADGGVWMGVAELQYWRNGRMTEFGEVRDVYGIYRDRSGAVWAGTGQFGLFRGKAGIFSPVASEAGSPFQVATSFAEGADGTFYAGSWHYGLLEYRDGRTASFDHRNGLPSDEVRALCVDHEGILWAGFGNRGLAARIDGRWWNPNELSETLADHVSAILEDGADRLWLGTPAGIYYAPNPELVAAARGQGSLPRLRTATTGDNSHRPATWSGAQPTAWKARDGRLLFATRLGVVVIDPSSFRAGATAPPVHLETVAIDQRELRPGPDLRVPAGARRVAIAYSAPGFNEPHEIQYRFKLEGYDQDWISGGTAREADYAQLPPGAFVFRAMAANGDGVWGREATLRLEVEPYLWQRPWVRVAALAAFTLLLVGLVRYVSFRRLRRQLRQLEERAALEKERSRIARDIHDDVGNRLTEIILLSRLALRRNPPPGERDTQLRQIATSATQVTDALDEIVWAISPRRDTFRHLVAYIAEFAVDFLRAAGVACRIELPDELPDRAVAAEMRHNVFLAVKEALNNIVRHAEATEALLRVEIGPERATIVIKDNGRGLPPAAESAGANGAGADGLRNMRQRMEEIRGRFAIDSGPGGGTAVSFEFRCPQTE